MANKHPESQLQQSCVRWFRYQYPRYLIFAIPNGGKRSKTEAAIMQGEGVLSGIPDLQICLDREKTFFVEMKSPMVTQYESIKDLPDEEVIKKYSYNAKAHIRSLIEPGREYVIEQLKSNYQPGSPKLELVKEDWK